jgi:hypothetical protein
MEQETVHKRKWVEQDYFLDMLAATNLIPGPNASEWHCTLVLPERITGTADCRDFYISHVLSHLLRVFSMPSTQYSTG